MDIERKKMSSREIIFGVLIAALYLVPNLWDFSSKHNVPISTISYDMEYENIEGSLLCSFDLKKIPNRVFGLIEEEAIKEEDSDKVDANGHRVYELSEDKKQICHNGVCFEFIAILHKHKPFAIFYDIKEKVFLTLQKDDFLYKDIFIKKIDKEMLLLGSADKSYSIDIGYVDASQFKQKDNN